MGLKDFGPSKDLEFDMTHMTFGKKDDISLRKNLK